MFNIQLKESLKEFFMTIANELSADVATALLVNNECNPDELLKIVETVHLELRVDSDPIVDFRLIEHCS